jgi:hypothetical protein
MVASSRFIILFAAYQKVSSTPGTQKSLLRRNPVLSFKIPCSR